MRLKNFHSAIRDRLITDRKIQLTIGLVGGTLFISALILLLTAKVNNSNKLNHAQRLSSTTTANITIVPGQVAGIMTDYQQNTPTPYKAKILVKLSPTTTQSASNQHSNNQGSNASANTQSQGAVQNSNVDAPNPTAVPMSASPTSVPVPTTQPTPDNSPLEVSYVPNINGNSFTFTATANKQIKRCEWDWYSSGGSGIAGNSNGNDNSCSGSGGFDGSSMKLYVKVISIYDEVKEFGDKKPCTGNSC